MSPRLVGRLAMDVLAVALIVLAVVMLSGRVAVQPVLSGSMTGYAGRGDLVIGVDTDPTSLEVGDVILFAPPAPYETPGNHPVAHRIRDIELVDGSLVATTQGDVNAQPDPWTLDLAHTRTAQVQLVLPHAGWPFIRLQLLATPAGRMTAGLTLMASGALLLMLGRQRSRRSDERWPPAFEGEGLEARLQLLQQRHAEADLPPSTVSRFGPVPVPPPKPARGPLIPRQWSRQDVLAHFPID
jgi:signal peptidase I